MGSKRIERVLKRMPRTQLLTNESRQQFVMLRVKEYRRLLEALEDAADLIDFDRAKAANAGDRPVPWSEAKTIMSARRAAAEKRRRRSA